MTGASLISEETAGGLRVKFSGPLLTRSLGAIEAPLAALRPKGAAATLDLSQVEALDTGGAWIIADLRRRFEAQGAAVTLTGAQPAQEALIRTVTDNLQTETSEDPHTHKFVQRVERLGEGTVGAYRSIISAISFFGLTLHRLVRSLLMPWRLRAAPLVTQMDETGLKAVPIIALMGFLIGVVLAFQGAAQLQQFGAEVFVVELISVSILRELGILLTAIIVAGRSGSAFTASIGSMKVQEEIDAMRTLGLDPVEVLVVPRVLALLIVLPILGAIANLSGLIGGALMSWIDLGVSPGMFATRLKETTDVWTATLGLIKAPFFALVIGVVACWQATQVKGSSDSVGRKTTASVVQSIFLVIALDALFSVFFSLVGI